MSYIVNLEAETVIEACYNVIYANKIYNKDVDYLIMSEDLYLRLKFELSQNVIYDNKNSIPISIWNKTIILTDGNNVLKVGYSAKELL